MIGLFFCVLFRKLDEKGLLYVQLLLLFTILREHFQWWQLAPALKKSLGNRWRRRSLGEKQGNIPALELTEQSGHKLLSQDRVSSTRYLKPRLLLHVQDQLGTLYLLLLHTTYSEKKFSMYYRIDTNTTALLIRAACGNFLNKSPLFVANIWLKWSKLAQIWMQRHQKAWTEIKTAPFY